MSQYPILWAAFDDENKLVQAALDPVRLGPPTPANRITSLRRYLPFPTDSACVSFDLDGVLAINEERAHIIQSIGTLATRSYAEITEVMSSVGDDEPGPFMQLAILLGQSGIPTYVVSSRPDSVYENTAAWLRRHNCAVAEIFLRHEYQKTKPGAEVKRLNLMTLAARHDHVIHIDDDPAMLQIQVENVRTIVIPSTMPK